MKGYVIKIGMLIAAMLMLSACVTHNHNHFLKRDVTATKLANGKKLYVGFKEPGQANQCQFAGKETRSWVGQEMKGELHFGLGGGWYTLKKLAIKYANAHPKVNYAYIFVPNMTHILGVNVTPTRRVIIRYYGCKNPPAVHHNPFKD